MGRIYNGEEHRALEAEKTRLEQELSVVVVRMNDEYESDAWDDPERSHGKLTRYAADNQRHMQLSREIESVDRQIDRMEEIRPLSSAELRANPILDIRRRWCMRGAEMLDEGERQIFMPEMTAEIAKDLEKRGIPSTGEFFDPWALATKNSTEKMPITATQRHRARMAVGDPSRSDIDTESASGAGDEEELRTISRSAQPHRAERGRREDRRGMDLRGA